MNKTRSACALLLLTVAMHAQTLNLGIQNATGIVWKQGLYLMGLTEREGIVRFSAYHSNEPGKMEDSLSLNVGRGACADFLRLSCDTLHGSLNVYVQKKGENRLRIIRCNGQLQVTGDIAAADPARLNNTAMLGGRPFYYQSRVYAIKSTADTSGMQFYLNCYSLKDPAQNFDYLMSWQFAFERKNVEKAKVIHADKNRVFLFVDVGSGPKKGQWLLCLNARDGQLVRGSRISARGEAASYHFGLALGDSLNNELRIVGEKVTEGGKKNVIQVFHCVVDSLGEIPEKQVFTIPVSEPARGTTKTPPTFRIGFEKLLKTNEGVLLEADLYVSSTKAGCFNYCSTFQSKLVNGENGWVMEKTEARSNRTIEDWILLNDKFRINGQLCKDSVDQRSAKHESLPFPVKLGYRKEAGSGAWLLQRTETSKGRIGFAKTVAEKTKLRIEPIAEIPKNLAPLMLLMPRSRYVLLSEDARGGLQLSGGAW